MIKTVLLLSFFFINLNANANTGEKLFKACIACHGKDGHGNESLKAPRISGQYDWYIESTLNKFKNGERSNPAMLPILANLSKDDFKILADYISKMH